MSSRQKHEIKKNFFSYVVCIINLVVFFVGELQTIIGTKQPADITLFSFLHHPFNGSYEMWKFSAHTRKSFFSKKIFFLPSYGTSILRCDGTYIMLFTLRFKYQTKRKHVQEEREAVLLMTCHECEDKETQKFNCNSFQAKFARI